MSAPELDQRDRELLDALQFDFPLTVTPFRVLARRMGCTEGEVVSRIGALKQAGVIRQISPIYDSFHIGYRSTLAAFKVAPSRVEKVAAVLSANPGVSHNYLRDGDFNIWFTLTLPETKNMERAIGALAKKTGVADWLYLPALRTFKVNFRLDMGGGKGGGRRVSGVANRRQTASSIQADPGFIRATQGDLPLQTRPWSTAARTLGIPETVVVSTVRTYIKNSMIRRVAAVLRQKKAGFTENVMVAWAPAPATVEALGACAAAQKLVSHCYERPVRPDWPFSVYTMIHGKNKREVRGVIREIRRVCGNIPCRELSTLKEFKKVRVTYF